MHSQDTSLQASTTAVTIFLHKSSRLQAVSLKVTVIFLLRSSSLTNIIALVGCSRACKQDAPARLKGMVLLATVLVHNGYAGLRLQIAVRPALRHSKHTRSVCTNVFAVCYRTTVFDKS